MLCQARCKDRAPDSARGHLQLHALAPPQCCPSSAVWRSTAPCPAGASAPSPISSVSRPPGQAGSGGIPGSRRTQPPMGSQNTCPPDGSSMGCHSRLLAGRTALALPGSAPACRAACAAANAAAAAPPACPSSAACPSLPGLLGMLRSDSRHISQDRQRRWYLNSVQEREGGSAASSCQSVGSTMSNTRSRRLLPGSATGAASCCCCCCCHQPLRSSAANGEPSLALAPQPVAAASCAQCCTSTATCTASCTATHVTCRVGRDDSQRARHKHAWCLRCCRPQLASLSPLSQAPLHKTAPEAGRPAAPAAAPHRPPHPLTAAPHARCTPQRRQRAARRVQPARCRDGPSVWRRVNCRSSGPLAAAPWAESKVAGCRPWGTPRSCHRACRQVGERRRQAAATKRSPAAIAALAQGIFRRGSAPVSLPVQPLKHHWLLGHHSISLYTAYGSRHLLACHLHAHHIAIGYRWASANAPCTTSMPARQGAF